MSPLRCKRLILAQTGDLLVPVLGDHHCGKAEYVVSDRTRVKYTVRLVCRPRLSPRGFLYDQDDLRKVVTSFENQYTKASCEELVQRVAEKVARDVETSEPTCKVTEVHVTLSPYPYTGSVEAFYARK